MDLARRLAAQLPDEPRWLETRGMLLSPHAAVTGGESLDAGFVVSVTHGALAAVAVVGRPPADAIRSALVGATELTPVIAQTIDAAHVARALQGPVEVSWTSERAILHRLSAPAPRPDPDARLEIRVLTRDDSLSHLPAGLRHEMTHAQDFAPVGAVFVKGTPVSFCYPVWRTERLWDISIDTVEEHRGRSFGARAVWFMVDLMRGQGLDPVWGALESNTASLRLGAKLGFTPMDEIAVFSRGGWVFLSGGFTGA